MRFKIPAEALIWTLALVVLGVFGSSLAGHFTFCIPTLLGFDGCMGCGIGRSIGMALRGDFTASWQAHPLGIPAVFILSTHIICLTINANKLNTTLQGPIHG